MKIQEKRLPEACGVYPANKTIFDNLEQERPRFEGLMPMLCHPRTASIGKPEGLGNPKI
jgi:hypothetical protein